MYQHPRVAPWKWSAFIQVRGASLADKVRKMENFFVLPYAGHAYEYIFTNITPIGSAIHISQEM